MSYLHNIIYDFYCRNTIGGGMLTEDNGSFRLTTCSRHRFCETVFSTLLLLLSSSLYIKTLALNPADGSNSGACYTGVNEARVSYRRQTCTYENLEYKRYNNLLNIIILIFAWNELYQKYVLKLW